VIVDPAARRELADQPAIQRDLDTFMAFYNFQRTHQRYRVAGRTPAKALYDLIAERWLLPPISDAAREVAAGQLPQRHLEDGVSGK
jgi:hypothetical protein